MSDKDWTKTRKGKERVATEYLKKIELFKAKCIGHEGILDDLFGPVGPAEAVEAFKVIVSKSKESDSTQWGDDLRKPLRLLADYIFQKTAATEGETGQRLAPDLQKQLAT